VFCGIQLEELAHEFNDFSFVRTTSFGGLRYNCRNVLLDVWPLEKTFTSGRQKEGDISIQDVPRHAFLNVEAIAIEISSVKGKRRVFESGFSEAVRNGVLEINCKENPFPEISVLKALRSSITLNLSVGNRFIDYVRGRRWDMQDMQEAQGAHYGEILFYESHLAQISEMNSFQRTFGRHSSSVFMRV
jgi:hypothetical protein